MIPETGADLVDYRGAGWGNSAHVRAVQKTRPNVRFCLVFERELLSVPVMRRVLGDTLRGIGLNEESVDDILLAATEACTNVILHAGQSAPAYIVAATVDDAACRVEVTDDGEGCPQHLEAQHREAAVAALAETVLAETVLAETVLAETVLAESGRGFAIMEACVDAVTLRSAPGQGTQVVLDKRVSWPGQLV